MLLAINLLFLLMWSFASLEKVRGGMPSYFHDKFGETFLAKFPGLPATFWMLTASELLALALAVIALLRGEFLGRRSPLWLSLMLVCSLFVFVELALGLWVSKDYNGAVNTFAYFAGTLLALRSVESPREI